VRLRIPLRQVQLPDTPTRYRISVEMDVDESIIPGPHQRPFEPFPPWWIDNPLRLVERVTDYYVQVGAERALGDRIVLQRPSQPPSPWISSMRRAPSCARPGRHRVAVSSWTYGIWRRRDTWYASRGHR
jgi:hypothetical protein